MSEMLSFLFARDWRAWLGCPNQLPNRTLPYLFTLFLPHLYLLSMHVCAFLLVSLLYAIYATTFCFLYMCTRGCASLNLTSPQHTWPSGAVPSNAQPTDANMRDEVWPLRYTMTFDCSRRQGTSF